jgi:7,8-dihydropterin-6-yl-methyl-4-(beta-D-ribofuranosyl)aminobenzene 5'-phosphate synthase
MKGKHPFWLLLICAALPTGRGAIAAAPVAAHQVQRLKVTILSTMLADEGIGEWGFSALVEADGQQILVDTGARPQTVLQNARELNIDLSPVRDVLLTHFHSDHVGGLMVLRQDLKQKNADALSVGHVTPAIFYSRPQADGREGNTMIEIRAAYQASGAHFVEHSSMAEIMPGVWLTGPVPRVYPERNWSGSGKVLTPAGLVEDNVPDDQSLIIDTPQGLVVITGCGHAGIVNILTAADRQFHRPIMTVIGGIHLFAASDTQVNWTGDKMKGFGVHYLIGAHCTGIESVYRLRERLGLGRKAAVVGAVGATYTLAEGINPGKIAQ